jgi:hypothetical protein
VPPLWCADSQPSVMPITSARIVHTDVYMGMFLKEHFAHFSF